MNTLVGVSSEKKSMFFLPVFFVNPIQDGGPLPVFPL